MTKHLSSSARNPQGAPQPPVRRNKRGGLVIGVVAVAFVAIVAAVVLNQYGAKDDTDKPAAFDTVAFTGGPRLAVDQTTIDHGDVPFGHQVTAEYRLKNVGDQVLKIDEPAVKTLEGC